MALWLSGLKMKKTAKKRPANVWPTTTGPKSNDILAPSNWQLTIHHSPFTIDK
jgi:hypothetical protein